MKQFLCVSFVVAVLALSLESVEAQVMPFNPISSAIPVKTSMEDSTAEPSNAASSADSHEKVDVKLSRSLWDAEPPADVQNSISITLADKQSTWPELPHRTQPAEDGLDVWENNLPQLSMAGFPKFNLATIPEPSTFALVGFGVLALVILLKRR